MKRHYHAAAWMAAAVLAGSTNLLTAQQAETQPAAAPPPAAVAPKDDLGVIDGTNVYVRSGFSTNYYPVTKLNTGDRVKVVGEEFGWLKIQPPAGTFSLVDKTFIDKADDKSGVLNGRTWVFAGSQMDARRYAKQVQLGKGDRVSILGETEDKAFYMISPPPGAHLWVKADLVKRGPGAEALAGNRGPDAGGSPPAGARPNIEIVPPGGLDLAASDQPTTRPTVAPRIVPVEPIARTSTTRPAGPAIATDPVVIERFQIELNAIEAEIAAEQQKPLGEQSFDSIIAKLVPLAEQQTDAPTSEYARVRSEQLRDRMAIISALGDMKELKINAIATADEIAAQRRKLATAPPAEIEKIDVRGEIRVSSIYDGEAGRVKRWRIVEPGSEPQRTIAYIELPPGSPIDPVQFYGHPVGIKALSVRHSPDTIPPVPIFTVEQIKALDSSRSPAVTPNVGVAASEPPPTVSAPTLEPVSEAPAATSGAGPRRIRVGSGWIQLPPGEDGEALISTTTAPAGNQGGE